MTPRFRHGQLHVLFGQDLDFMVKISEAWKARHGLAGPSAGLVAQVHCLRGPDHTGYHAVLVGAPVTFDEGATFGLMFMCRSDRKTSKAQNRQDREAWQAALGSLPIGGAAKRRWVGLACYLPDLKGPRPLLWRIGLGSAGNALSARSGAV